MNKTGTYLLLLTIAMVLAACSAGPAGSVIETAASPDEAATDSRVDNAATT